MIGDWRQKGNARECIPFLCAEPGKVYCGAECGGGVKNLQSTCKGLDGMGIEGL